MEEEGPSIVCTPPGAKSRELLKIQEKFVPKAVHHTLPIFVASSRGALVTDVDGNVYLDFAAGISCLNAGHRNPKILRAITKQMNKYLHLGMHVTPYEPYIRVAEKLAEISPGNFGKKTVLINSGAEAVENAIKIARKYTRNDTIIVFENAFHGRTRLAMSLTGSVKPYKLGFGPQDSSVHRTPYAYCYRCSFGLEYPECHLRCVKHIEETLCTHLSPEDVAAILLEPIQGEGGFIVPPKAFVVELRRICDKYGFLLISDEVQSGIGRTGRMFATEHFDILPDIIVLSKSLGGGLPLGATIARADIMDSVQIGGLGGTFGGNPLSCVAALATLGIVQERLDAIGKLGSILRKKLVEMQEEYEVIGDVRGKGLMIAVELVKNRESKQPARKEQTAILRECHRRGLIIMGAGVHKNVVRFLPPLTISATLLQRGLEIFEKAVRIASRGLARSTT